MRSAAILFPLVAVLAGLSAYTSSRSQPRSPAPPAVEGQPRVKLAVLIVFDQMMAGYLEKWQPQFGEGGFARLQGEGAWFTNCYYPYGTTSTGPGHASMLTGTCPDRHGIVNNNWYDPALPGDVYCAGSSRYQAIPSDAPAPEPSPPKKEASTSSGTPERLRSETVADVLRKAYGERTRIFGLSLKDRSAILPCGRAPTGAYWFNGRFITSDYYADQPHKWVTAFNTSGKAAEWFGRPWERFRPELDYVKLSGADAVAGESKGVEVDDGPSKGWSQGVAFPHPNTGGAATPGRKYYDSLQNSPSGNELLLAFAKSCILSEELGRRSVPDLLVVSFSSNDLIGHTWGPDSQEVLDVTLRSDAILADMLSFLDEYVGEGEYVLALTADHGSCPLPEVSRGRGVDAVRVDPTQLREELVGALQRQFGPGKWVEAFMPPWVTIDRGLAARKGVSVAEVARAAAKHLSTHPRMYRTYTREELAKQRAGEDVIDRRVRRSYTADRCGDVYAVLKPYDLFSSPSSKGTSHGSPHDYDCHVPLLVLGPGIAGGPRSEAVTPQAAAAILAHYLGLRKPADCEFPIPASLGQ